MKKIIIGLLLLVGCTYSSGNIPIKYGKEEPDRVTFERIHRNLHIVTIDRCEYIWFNMPTGAGLTHKGDCKNHQNYE